MKFSYPSLALGLGLLLGLILMQFGLPGPEGEYRLPLLTLLLMSEFGFIITAVAAGLSARNLIRQGTQLQTLLLLIGNLLLALGFLWLGLTLWPHSSGG